MASLIDELINVLQKEADLYEKIIPISELKSVALIKEDLVALEKVTNQEQELLDKAANLEADREKILANMGMVLGKDPKELSLSGLIEILGNQPEERQRLSMVHDKLKKTMSRLVQVNEKNKTLIENSLEMIEFNLNFMQSTRMSPGNNNYNKNATSVNGADSRYMSSGSFDAKQ